MNIHAILIQIHTCVVQSCIILSFLGSANHFKLSMIQGNRKCYFYLSIYFWFSYCRKCPDTFDQIVYLNDKKSSNSMHAETKGLCIWFSFVFSSRKIKKNACKLKHFIYHLEALYHKSYFQFFKIIFSTNLKILSQWKNLSKNSTLKSTESL